MHSAVKWYALPLLALIAGSVRVVPAQERVVAQVVGTVYDSVAMRPLAGAVVRLFRAGEPASGRTARSDETGRFAYDSVPAGVWLVSFLHPVLDALRVDPLFAQLQITESGLVSAPLFIPSARALVAAACGVGTSNEFGLVVGEIRRAADNAPLAGATVAVEWPEWVLRKKRLVTEELRKIARSDSAGRYALCGAPAGSTVRAVAWSGTDTSGAIELAVPPSGYALQDFTVAPAHYAPLGADSAELGNAAVHVRRGRGTVRGRVLTPTGAPLANAAVRVLGSGTQVRTSTTGTFVIDDAVAGTQSVEARAIGFQPERRAVQLTESGVVEVSLTLAVRHVSLDTVRVFAGRELPWEVRGIERRWRTGIGKFLDGRTVRERSAFYTSDALRSIAGVQVRSSGGGFGQQVLMRNMRGQLCQAILFVDGIAMDAAGSGGMTLDDFATPSEVAVVEVYARASLVPAEYLTMHRDCGVVAVWTRFGTQNVRLLPPRSAPK